MNRRFSNLSEVYAHGFDTVIDVRSPAEYAEDHWPGAVSLPVLDNEQRAVVGTVYKQQSPFRARVLGASLVAANAAAHLAGPLADKPGGWRPLVYCWRGGQRSGSFASILAQVGWRVGLVEGGYRTYRRMVADFLHERPLPHRFVVLDGNTGTAKTELLGHLQRHGLQVLDLEGLAAHRGSLFGAMSHPQPAQKAFESLLAQALHRLDPVRPVVVEAESSKIGDLIVPPSVWDVMKTAPRVAISAPVLARAAYLVRAYDDALANPERLGAVLAALVPYHGVEKVNHWRQLYQGGALDDLAAELIEQHYDPRYSRTRKSHPQAVEVVETPDLAAPDLERLAGQLADAVLRADVDRLQPAAR